ncbi:MAG: transglutaminase-like domain-containing protein [Syntrophomonadaceae bacterium]|nr:transglutaminase-like domain-containing protein [Syntrophomonadaceae bacterium]
MHKKLLMFILIAVLVGGGFFITPLTGDYAAASDYANDKAVVDVAHVAEGYLSVTYTGGKSVKIKVQISNGASSTTYTYDLNNEGRAEAFPLSQGDGTYNVRIFENVSGTKYSQAFACKVNVALNNQFSPFLNPNQYVNFTPESQVVAVAEEITAASPSDFETLKIVYYYMIDNFVYDYDRAATVKSGYLPVVDSVLAEKKGICFDYSAVMCSMLRSQGVPCKLVIGYAGDIYHAWINAYLPDVGWIDHAIYFDGQNWSLMDPTFASGSRSASGGYTVTPDQINYSMKYAY